jgi:uncharacterized lipoprotein YddW (UPF0748 family)
VSRAGAPAVLHPENPVVLSKSLAVRGHWVRLTPNSKAHVKSPLLLIVAMLLVAAGSHAAPPPESVVRLAAGNDPAAWKEHERAPPPQAGAAGGVEFTCPFGGDLARTYWDRAVNADLSTATSIEVDIECDQPDALRSLGLYLKSGKGWFTSHTRLTAPGRQRVLFPRGAFTGESKPDGWNKIEALRLSAWRGQAKNVRLVLHGAAARLGGVVVVQGTASVGDPDERKTAERAARLIHEWLTDAGVGHDLVRDEAAATALAHARVAILPYNPNPPARELKVLLAFLQRGGKLMVFYGNNAALAQAMHFTLGGYQRAETPGRWSSLGFTDPAGWNVPARVHQESSHILPVLPADDSARVIAWWENRLGGRTASPAWTASAQGLWMAHILQDEDLANKRRMLLGLLGRLDPDIWPQAAQQALYRAGCMANASSYAARRASLAATLTGERLAEADRLYTGLAELFKARRYAEVVDQASALDRTITTAYATAQPAQRDEFRGVWEHTGLGLYPGDWERTCRELATNHLNALFVNLLSGGVAHYPNPVLPSSTSFRRYGDQLAAALKAAHAHGLQVHCWAICWNPGNAPDEFMAKLKKAGRLQQTAAGKVMPWLSPSHPDNVALLLKAYEDLARRYPVDGLHLDYVRYSDRSVDFSPATRRAFEQWRGRGPVADWPRCAVLGGALATEFEHFRVETITTFVREVSRRVRAVRPGIKISAAVYAAYPECVRSVGQDWAAWLKNGYVDFVCPMNYTENTPLFLTRAAAHLALPGAAGRVYEGLGIASLESQLRPDQAVEQIVGLRKLGVPGFVLFDLSRPLRDEILPYLRLGVLKE